MMQVLVIITGALLCSQLANAWRRQEVAFVSSAEADNLRVQVKNNVYFESVRLSRWMLNHGGIMVGNVVRDLNEITVKSEALQANITHMSHIATESFRISLETKKDGENIFDYVNKLTNMLDDYEAMPADSELRNTLKTALESNGYHQFKNQSKQKISELHANFEVACNKFIQVLSPSERERRDELIQWFNDFKAETDKEKKAEKFVKVLFYLS